MAAGVSRVEPYTRDILRLAAAIPGQVGFAQIENGAELRSRTCGSRVRVAVTLDRDGRIAELRQAVEACAYGQAAAALMGARAVGLDLGEAKAELETVERWLAGARAEWLAPLSPALERSGRHEALLLPFRTLVRAIEAAAR